MACHPEFLFSASHVCFISMHKPRTDVLVAHFFISLPLCLLVDQIRCTQFGATLRMFVSTSQCCMNSSFFCVCLFSSELSVHFTPILLCQAGEGVSCLAVLPILAFGLFGHCRPQSLASGGTFWVGYTLRFLDSDYVHRSRRHIV